MMGEPTPVDPMSDDCVNVECILRPIKGVEGGSSKSPVGFLRPRLGRRATSEGCGACCAAVGLNRWSGKLADGCRKTCGRPREEI